MPRPLSPERRQQMLELVHRAGHVQVNELSERFGVSKVTIRGDLDWLAEQNLVARARGGAVGVPGQALTAAFSERTALYKAEKQRIAKAAALLLEAGETILLDAGSTVYELSKLISAASGLTVVTPALNIATQLGGLPGVELIIVGGRLDPHTIATTGPTAEREIMEIRVHKLFLGAHGIDREGDVVDVSLEVARLKRAMIAVARQVILLADSSKWGRTGQARVVDLASVNTVITDSGLSAGARRAIRDAGVQLMLA
jgi:DeoR family transcriptional regulator of aga operon